MKSASLNIVLLCASLLIANGFFHWLVDGDMGMSWEHNVLRNWDQFGLTRLKGQLVQNPGGHDALVHPDIYPGPRPASLYPAYVVGRLFAWTGLYALPYHFFCSLASLISIYYLLGASAKAFFLGGVAILTPGYLIEPTVLDPNDVAILSGLPYAAILWWQLSLPKLKSGNFIFLAIATFAFTSLNWTTALIHAQIFLTLLIGRKIPVPRLGYYVLIGAVSAALVVAISLLSKYSVSGHGSHALREFWGGYMWGNTGYSNGSDTRTLLVRVAFINLLGLLPLWLLLAWTLFHRAISHPSMALFSLAPLVLAMIEVLVMRNYFSHHPWLAAPLLLVAWVLTMKLLEAAVYPSASKNLSAKPLWHWAPAWSVALILTFGFGLAVLLVNRIHGSRIFSLTALVRHGTSRADQIVVVENRDPQLVAVADRLAETLDRQVGFVDTLPAPQNSAAGAVLLSAEAMGEGWHESGRTTAADTIPLVQRVLQWFTSHISKRKPGDKMEIADTYYMYFVTPPMKFKIPAPKSAPTPAPVNTLTEGTP